MGDDSIDMVISHIDMGYLVTLGPRLAFHRAGRGVQHNLRFKELIRCDEACLHQGCALGADGY